MKRSRIALLVVGATLLSVVWAAQAAKVTMNGKVVSTSVRVIDGQAYVRLADVAKAFDMTVAKNGASYDLVKAGGANQLKGTAGKLGEEVFTGEWKFTVTDMQRADVYKARFNPNVTWDTTPEAGDELVILTCRFKNAVPKTVYMYFNGLGSTSLTDMAEHAYPVKLFDSRGGVAENILPGAAKEFAVVFAVPKGTEVKDFIYTIEPVSSDYKKVDLRVSLRQ